jgi:hypothetical protein
MLKEIGGITFYKNDEATKEEWNHNPNAEVAPGWVLVLVAVGILVLFVLVMNAHHLLPIIN